VWEFFRELVFPRACIGCRRDGILLCTACARTSDDVNTTILEGLETLSCVPYVGIVREAINEFKRGRRAFAGDLAVLAMPYVDRSLTLVPIPTTRRRRAERGFDQTSLMARILQRCSGAKVADLLARRGGAPQQGRSRVERLESRGRFGVRRGASASGGRLVLFDDVRTTGATLADAAATLAEAGFVVSGALTIAWTPRAKAGTVTAKEDR
jgi:ComF family protein